MKKTYNKRHHQVIFKLGFQLVTNSYGADERRSRHPIYIKMMFSVLLALFSLMSISVDAKDAPIHFIETRQVEFVSGGGIETITLEITAPEFTAPFRWNVTVKNSSGILFKVERNDAWLDAFFADHGYVTGCRSYIECKNQWYFKDLVKDVFNAPRLFPPPQTAPENWKIEALQNLGSEFLRQRNVAPNKISAVIVEMQKQLSKGHSMIVVPKSPVEDGASYMYVKSLNYFVPYGAG